MTDQIKRSSRGPYLVEAAVTLIWSGPIHVGTGEHLSVVTDAPIMRDEEGYPILPGSAIRGVLRSWAEAEAPLLGVEREAVVRLFGPATKEMTSNDRQGRLTVGDGTFLQSGGEIRDHVRMDRATEAAALGGKFDQELTHADRASFTLRY